MAWILQEVGVEGRERDKLPWGMEESSCPALLTGCCQEPFSIGERRILGGKAGQVSTQGGVVQHACNGRLRQEDHSEFEAACITQ